MRVLFVTHNFPRTLGDAAGSFVLRLAHALEQNGHTVRVLAPDAAGLKRDATIDGVAVRRVRYARDAWQTLAYTGTMAEAVRDSWGGRFALLGLLWHMQRAIRNEVAQARRDGHPFDVVHAHWWFPSGVSAWAGGAGTGSAPPLVVTMHGSDVRLAIKTKPAHPVMRNVLRRAQVVTAVSQWLAHSAHTITEVPVEVAPMPVDTSRFVPPEQRPSSAEDAPHRARFLFVGRLNEQKGLRELLIALARTQHRVGLDVVGDGPDREALLAQAESLGISDRITWHGALPGDHLPTLYQHALATVMPSREEGLGLVAVESQLCGAPVIAYRSGGLVDIVHPDAGGTLIEPGDRESLTRALDRFASDPRLAVDHGLAGRARVLEQFAPTAVAARYTAIYQLAVERHTSGVPHDQSHATRIQQADANQ